MMAITVDGKIYSGLTADAVVSRMRESGIFTASKTNDEYMRFVSRQVLHLNSQFVRFNSVDNFLHDLNSNGVICMKGEIK